MAKRMLECIETVIMEDGAQAFTEGNLYRPYKYWLQDEYSYRDVLCVKNDFKKRHVVFDKGVMEDFKDKHFKEVKV